MDPSEVFEISLDRSDVLSILIYVLVRADIKDLRAQLMMM